MKKITFFRITAYSIIVLIATLCELVVQRASYDARGYMGIGGEILVFPTIVLICSYILERIISKVGVDKDEDQD